MATYRQLRESVITFLREEYRHGTLRADPDQVCSLAFLDHLKTFIEAQEGTCRACAAVAA
jgi:hypothetical protein